MVWLWTSYRIVGEELEREREIPPSETERRAHTVRACVCDRFRHPAASMSGCVCRKSVCDTDRERQNITCGRVGVCKKKKCVLCVFG